MPSTPQRPYTRLLYPIPVQYKPHVQVLPPIYIYDSHIVPLASCLPSSVFSKKRNWYTNFDKDKLLLPWQGSFLHRNPSCMCKAIPWPTGLPGYTYGRRTVWCDIVCICAPLLPSSRFQRVVDGLSCFQIYWRCTHLFSSPLTSLMQRNHYNVEVDGAKLIDGRADVGTDPTHQNRLPRWSVSSLYGLMRDYSRSGNAYHDAHWRNSSFSMCRNWT